MDFSFDCLHKKNQERLTNNSENGSQEKETKNPENGLQNMVTNQQEKLIIVLWAGLAKLVSNYTNKLYYLYFQNI